MSDPGKEGVGRPTVTIRLWDPALRVFHWALLTLVVMAYVSAEQGRVQLHMWIGLAIIGLLVFRVLWGFFGSPAARFADFVPGPGRLFGYLAHVGAPRPSRWAGHNPLGGLAVVAMLAVLIVHATVGLFIQDTDYLYHAPLSYHVSEYMALNSAKWHELSFDILLILVALHLVAIAFYAVWKKEDLIGPMIGGAKDVEAPAVDKAAFSLPRFLLCALAGVIVVFALTRFW